MLDFGTLLAGRNIFGMQGTQKTTNAHVCSATQESAMPDIKKLVSSERRYWTVVASRAPAAATALQATNKLFIVGI
jgi:hypothetical protein